MDDIVWMMGLHVALYVFKRTYLHLVFLTAVHNRRSCISTGWYTRHLCINCNLLSPTAICYKYNTQAFAHWPVMKCRGGRGTRVPNNHMHATYVGHLNYHHVYIWHARLTITCRKIFCGLIHWTIYVIYKHSFKTGL